MKRIGIVEENKRMKPVRCSTGMPTDRNNNADQARTPGWHRSASQRLCTPARAGQVERRSDGLYFPANSEDATARPATEPPASGDAPVRDACISLLIPGSRSFRRPPNRPRGDGPERGGLYFSVNSRNDSPGTARLRVVADRCRFRRMLRLPKPDRHCKSLQIVADTHAAAVGPSSATEAFLLREIAAAA
jgi:hypothetical protein